MSPRTHAVLTAGALLWATSLLAVSRANPATPLQTAVTIDNFSFKAPEITVAAGTRVTWTNRDDIPHTVTADSSPPAYRSHPLDTGDSFSTVFAKPGTYRYFCSLHPKMRGTVIVQ